MEFTEIGKNLFTTPFCGITQLGENVIKGINFFNNTFGNIVTKISAVWADDVIVFTVSPFYKNTTTINRNAKSDGNKVFWQENSYEIIWKETNTAKSYHTAISEGDLREEYKNKVACLCRETSGKWKIDRIIKN